ncbi:hypothetical protein HK104_003390 [Borealophlyctis nickersoniae]|nr:hypothetical protein HK104_003390 [Borealophlyctis nickersoniae]
MPVPRHPLRLLGGGHAPAVARDSVRAGGLMGMGKVALQGESTVGGEGFAWGCRGSKNLWTRAGQRGLEGQRVLGSRPGHATLQSYDGRQPTRIAPLLATTACLKQVRYKTYYKRMTKPQKRWFQYVEKLAAQGKSPPERTGPLLENKFFKVVGDMKIHKPVTNGSRHRREPTRFHLYEGGCIKRLAFRKNHTGGRNNTGRITVRGRGGGYKRLIREVDFYRNVPGPHEVVRLEPDPNRSAELALLRNLATNEFSYIIRPAGLDPGMIVQSWRSGIPEPRPGEEPIPKYKMIQVGNCLRIKDIPVGTIVHCIGKSRDAPGAMCRAAGTSGQILHTADTGYAQIRVQSKEVRMVSVNACATIGEVGNKNHHLTVLGKAGLRRHMGFRPKVRGIAMSPVHHPHGGGRKSKGGRPPRSPWGWLTKGWRTVRGRRKWYIITPHWKVER